MNARIILYFIPCTLQCTSFTLCSKTDRKINFAQFQKALELVAEKKYPDEGVSGVEKLKAKIIAGKGPGKSGVTVRPPTF